MKKYRGSLASSLGDRVLSFRRADVGRRMRDKVPACSSAQEKPLAPRVEIYRISDWSVVVKKKS